jgi:hypothetical protein
VTEHECSFPEVKILETEGELKAGMKVLIPCPVCGETPLDTIEFMENRQDELQAALLAYQPHIPLFHWAPATRRGQIERYGLRPKMRASTSLGNWKAPYVCLADSPSWAWALSGSNRWTVGGEWDLWMTWMAKVTQPSIQPAPDRPTGIYEVRTEHRIFKRDLWYVGSRVKE